MEYAAKIEANTPPESPSNPSITPPEKSCQGDYYKNGIIKMPKYKSPLNGICIETIPNL